MAVQKGVEKTNVKLPEMSTGNTKLPPLMILPLRPGSLTLTIDQDGLKFEFDVVGRFKAEEREIVLEPAELHPPVGGVYVYTRGAVDVGA